MDTATRDIDFSPNSDISLKSLTLTINGCCQIPLESLVKVQGRTPTLSIKGYKGRMEEEEVSREKGWVASQFFLL